MSQELSGLDVIWLASRMTHVAQQTFLFTHLLPLSVGRAGGRIVWASLRLVIHGGGVVQHTRGSTWTSTESGQTMKAGRTLSGKVALSSGLDVSPSPPATRQIFPHSHVWHLAAGGRYRPPLLLFNAPPPSMVCNASMSVNIFCFEDACTEY